MSQIYKFTCWEDGFHQLYAYLYMYNQPKNICHLLPSCQMSITNECWGAAQPTGCLEATKWSKHTVTKTKGSKIGSGSLGWVENPEGFEDDMGSLGWVNMVLFFSYSLKRERGELISGGLILFPPIQWIYPFYYAADVGRTSILPGSIYLAVCVVGCATYSNTTLMSLYLRRSRWAVCRALWISVFARLEMYFN